MAGEVRMFSFKIADLVDAAVGRRIDLYHVERILRIDLPALAALVARFAELGEFGIRAALFAVQELREEPRRRRLSRAARRREKCTPAPGGPLSRRFSGSQCSFPVPRSLQVFLADISGRGLVPLQKIIGNIVDFGNLFRVSSKGYENTIGIDRRRDSF